MTEPAGPDAPAPGPAGGSPNTQTGDEALLERRVDSRVLHKGRYLEFRIDTVERADGTRAERDIVGHPGAVAILAIDDAGQVLLVRQFRLPADRVLLEVPAGTLDVDPETGEIENPDLAARRELEEETGFRARSWRKLASFWTAPGFATELMHLYLATELEPAHEGRLGPDEDERLELERVPFRDAVSAAERGEIADAKSLVALLWLDRLTPLVEGEPATGRGATGERVAVTFRPTLREAIEASIAVSRRRVSSQIGGALVIACGILTILANAAIVGVVLAVLGVAMMTGTIVAPFVVLAVRRRRDLILAETSATFDSVGAEHVNARGRSALNWSAFRRVRESPGYFFLETGLAVIYVPKRALTETQLAAFRGLLAEAGFGPDGRRVRATPPE